jgi:alkanesulfonate monooxygenase SsuD/methylene tetrahydromethanopterin reductase-like flavin-dependent oxidoreductase (luciferase family)
MCAGTDLYESRALAQAGATLGDLYGDRFWLAVAPHELTSIGPAMRARDETARNEYIALGRSADIIRALWTGESMALASLNTRVKSVHPVATPPFVVGVALTPEDARTTAGWADALMTVADSRQRMVAIVNAFREGGGQQKPLFLLVNVMFRAIGQRVSRRQFATPSHTMGLRLVGEGVQSRPLRRSPVANQRTCVGLRASPDVDRHIGWLQADAQLGFDRIYLHNADPTLDGQFIDVCATRLLPAFSPPLGSPAAGQPGAGV